MVERQQECRTRPRLGLRWWFRPSGPAPIAAVVLAMGKGLMQQNHPRRPLTREWARSPRLCGRPHPAAPGETVRFGPLGGTAAAHIGARVGKSGAEANRSVGETGLDRPSLAVASVVL